jgi:hypothetical protein
MSTRTHTLDTSACLSRNICSTPATCRQGPRPDCDPGCVSGRPPAGESDRQTVSVSHSKSVGRHARGSQARSQSVSQPRRGHSGWLGSTWVARGDAAQRGEQGVLLVSLLQAEPCLSQSHVYLIAACLPSCLPVFPSPHLSVPSSAPFHAARIDACLLHAVLLML